MALGSTVSFTGIIGEWGELSYSGQTVPYSYAPVSMRQFLRGASVYPYGPGGGAPIDLTGYVPDNYGSTGGIASSGDLVMSTFKNTKVEWDGQACVNEWFNYRGYYYRNWYYPTQFPGDSLVANQPHNRYQSSYTQAYSYDYPTTANTGYSKWHTTIDWVTGAQASITGAPYSGNSNVSWSSTYGEMSLRLGQDRVMARNRSLGSISYNRLGNNSGAWNGQFLMPGKWGVTTNNIHPVNPGTTAGVSGSDPNLTNYPYVVSVPAGAIYIFMAYATSFDSNLFDNFHSWSTNGTGQKDTAWWYNSCVTLFYVNNNNYANNVSINGAWYPETDKYGSWTGNFAASGMFTTYHQDFILTRTY